MKSNTNQISELDVLNGVRYDCKLWRKLVSKCAQTDAMVTPSTEEQYKVVHARILSKCRDVAAQEAVPESHRRVARQLNELLRSWSSTKLFKDVPTQLVLDLLNSESSLEERLRGTTHRSPLKRIRNLVLTACVAGVAGIFIVLLLQSMNSNVLAPYDSVQGFLASIANYLAQTTFTEQFAIAVLFAWLLGTWLLSWVYSN